MADSLEAELNSDPSEQQPLRGLRGRRACVQWVIVWKLAATKLDCEPATLHLLHSSRGHVHCNTRALFPSVCFVLLPCFLLWLTAVVVWRSSRSRSSPPLQASAVFFGVRAAVWANHCKYLNSARPRQSQSSNPHRSHTSWSTYTHTLTLTTRLIATCSGLRNLVDADWTCQSGTSQEDDVVKRK